MCGTRYNYFMACDRPGFNLPYRDVVKVRQWLVASASQGYSRPIIAFRFGNPSFFCFLSFFPTILDDKICLALITELSRSVWENLDRGREYRPNAARSVNTTKVKILPRRPTEPG